MEKLQAFKYELQPNGENERDMYRAEGCCRFVFNKALALQKENYESGKKFINYGAMAKSLTCWRNTAETAWLKDAPFHSLQHSLKDLEKAYKNFFAKRADFPRFKKKGDGGSFRYPDPLQIKLDEVNSRIFLPKLGWIRYRKSRDIIGELRNVTVSKTGKKWFVSIQTRSLVEDPITKATSVIGIDVGVAQFATMSNGTHIAPLNSFKKHSARLAKRQRDLSRKVKFSNNWKKAKNKVLKVHTQISNARKDFLHKITTEISQNHAVVCIEDLQIRKMSKSVTGTSEKPNKEAKKKSRLNRCILDQGWGIFRTQLEYKLKWKGGMLLAVPPYHTSQTCPSCHHVSIDNRKTQSSFKCILCTYENNADIVGAINILERGYRLLACGEFVKLSSSTKQEPTEVSQLVF